MNIFIHKDIFCIIFIMSHTGGLIQLITNNTTDIKPRINLTNNPEVFPFFKIYKKYTHFSIDNHIKYLGNFKEDNRFMCKLKNNGDLLGNIHVYIKFHKKYNYITNETLNFDIFNIFNEINLYINN